MKRLAGYAAVVLTTLLLAALLWEFRGVLLMFVFSLAIAAALRPLADRQVQRGWPRGLAIMLVYGLTFGLVFAIVWSLAPSLLTEIRLLADRLAIEYDRLYATWPEGSEFQKTVVGLLPPPADLYEAIAGPRGEEIFQQLLGFTANLFQSASQLVVVVFLSLYWALDQVRFERLWLALLPAERRARAREIWRAIETGVGAYIRSEVAQSLLAGLVLGVGYRLLNLDYPVLLAVASALAWLVPWLGVTLALVPVLLVAWPAGALVTALGVAFTILVFVVLEFVVEPRLYNRRQYNSLLIVLMMLALGMEFGLAGVLVAPPLSAALQILGSHLLASSRKAPDKSIAEQFGALEARLNALRARLAQAPEAPGPQVASLVERLDELMEKVNRTVRTS